MNINIYYLGLEYIYIIKCNLIRKKMLLIGLTRRNEQLFRNENQVFILNFPYNSVQAVKLTYSCKLLFTNETMRLLKETFYM